MPLSWEQRHQPPSSGRGDGRPAARRGRQGRWQREWLPEEDGRVVRRVVCGGPIPQRHVRRDRVIWPPWRVRHIVDDTGDARSCPPKDDGSAISWSSLLSLPPTSDRARPCSSSMDGPGCRWGTSSSPPQLSYDDVAFVTVMWAYSHFVDPIFGGAIGMTRVVLGMVWTVLGDPRLGNAIGRLRDVQCGKLDEKEGSSACVEPTRRERSRPGSPQGWVPRRSSSYRRGTSSSCTCSGAPWPRFCRCSGDRDGVVVSLSRRSRGGRGGGCWATAGRRAGRRRRTVGPSPAHRSSPPGGKVGTEGAAARSFRGGCRSDSWPCIGRSGSRRRPLRTFSYGKCKMIN
jgi:hypothetical protein